MPKGRRSRRQLLFKRLRQLDERENIECLEDRTKFAWKVTVNSFICILSNENIPVCVNSWIGYFLGKLIFKGDIILVRYSMKGI